MPTSVGTAGFAFAAVLTAVSPVAAAIVAAITLLWELFVFIHAGRM